MVNNSSSSLPVEGTWVSPGGSGFEFRIIRGSDHPPALEFFLAQFVHDEPTLKLMGKYGPQLAQDMRRIVSPWLEEGLSLMAEDAETGEVAGLWISFHRNPSTPGHIDDLEDLEVRSPQARNFLKMRLEAKRAAKIRERLGIESWVEMIGLCISPKHRRLGLATEFFNRAANLFRRKGHSEVVCIWTDPPTRHMVEKHGFKEVGRYDYRALLDDQGKRVFPDSVIVGGAFEEYGAMVGALKL